MPNINMLKSKPGRPASINRPGQLCLYLPQETIDWLKAQPEGASAYIRRLIEHEILTGR